MVKKNIQNQILEAFLIANLFAAVGFIFYGLSLSNQKFAVGVDKPELRSYGKIPLHFEPNVGQFSSTAGFFARGSSYRIGLSATHAYFRFLSHRLSQESNDSSHEIRCLDMQLLAANENAKATAKNQLPGKSNYFVGKDSSHWRTNVANFERVRFEEVYQGIDIEYYGTQNQLEYDFVVKPEHDPAQIQLRFDGITSAEINTAGELVLATEAGNLIQRKPVIYQLQDDGKREEIAGGYTVNGNNVSFWLSDYDRTRELVIDPVFVYSTYHGGPRDDTAGGITIGNDGSAYVIGTTTGEFPLVNPRYPVHSGGFDVFISKLDHLGTGFAYTTYLGGGGNDIGSGIKVDGNGNVYVSGVTNSSDFPVLNARQPNNNGGSDGFIAKLNASGNMLVFSTFHGGNGFDAVRGIALDELGNIYVAGETDSTAQFPLMRARQANNNGGTDAFVSALGQDGSQLIFSTFHGGLFYEIASAIDVSPAGDVFITGETQSPNFGSSQPYFPITMNARQPNIRGAGDAFVSRFKLIVDNENATTELALVYSTYFGGNSTDRGESIAFDPLSGRFHIVGSTSSTQDFPLVRSWQTQYGGGVADAFVVTFDGPDVYQSTYLGGNDWDMGQSVDVRSIDGVRKVYVAGMSRSADFPGNSNASTPDGNIDFDAFVSILEFTANTPQQGLIDGLVSTETFGGSRTELVAGMETNGAGNVFLTGQTMSSNFPTVNAVQGSYGSGANDAFITAMAAPPTPIRFTVSGRVRDQNGVGMPGIVVKASGNDNVQVASNTNGDYSLAPAANGYYTVNAELPSHVYMPAGGYPFEPLTGNEKGRDFMASSVINDNLADALEITNASGSVLGNQSGATREVGVEPNHGERTVWYKWRSPLTGRVKFFVTPGFEPISIDSVRGILTIYKGTAYDNLEVEGTVNQADGSINVDAVADQEYRIVVTTPSTFGTVRNFVLGWGDFVTISGSLFPQSTDSIVVTPVRMFATSLSGDPALIRSLLFSESSSQNPIRYFIRIPRGGSYAIFPESATLLSVTPTSQPLTNVLDDIGLVSFSVRWRRTLSFTALINTTVMPSDSSIAPYVHWVHPNNRPGGFAESTGGKPFKFTVMPPYPLDDPGMATAYHPNFSFGWKTVLADDSVSLVKTPSSCTYAVPTGAPSTIPASGGSFVLNVTPSPGTCSLSVASDFSWLSASVSGNSVMVTAQPNRTGSDRKGVITFGEGRSPYYIDQPSAPFLSVENATLIEGNSGNSFISIPVRKSGGGSVTVNWSTQNGTAMAGEDYMAGGGTLNFAPNETEKTIRVQINGDITYEQNEDVRIVLSNAVATITPIIENQGFALIVNDDAQQVPLLRTRFDYDGDGKTDVSVWRPGDGIWYILQSLSSSVRAQGWGLTNDKLGPADFDGDGKTDLAVFRESDSNWYIVNSSDNTVTVFGWGIAGDLPVPADYNGDQKADIAVYRPSESNWYRRDSDGQIHIYAWGIAGDKPAPADFNGDGVADMTVFRPSEGRWYTINSGDASISIGEWGISGDIPIPADYSGDGRTDFCVFRPSNSTWYRIHSNDFTIQIITWGLAGDLPVPGDYDGDGRSDLAVWRPSDTTWYLNTTTSGIYTQPFGLTGDKPTPNAFVY